MDLENLRVQNESRCEPLCFKFLHGSTLIEREVDEGCLDKACFKAETSLGEITLAFTEVYRNSRGILVSGTLLGSWTMREYYRILTELVKKYNFICSEQFWKMPEWLEGWVKDGLIDPE
ncbi:MAG: hypothetical protein HY918_02750 [Candidatus Doudnabacteria bacterium]|nr:hypothetical protein [Candidatus Doudnabacteria bacterium]